jgi:alpha-methylacyl-CoA racemase
VERAASGRGQVVDAAMVDGAALLSTYLHGMAARGMWTDERGSNLLDGGAPFYRSYRALDGGWMAVGAIEPQFYAELVRLLGLDAAVLPGQMDRSRWPELQAAIAAAFAERSREEWTKVFDGTDACVSPVLAPGEAHAHPHNAARGTFLEVAGLTQPAPAPRFARTPATAAPAPPSSAGDPAVLTEWGLTPDQAAALS